MTLWKNQDKKLECIRNNFAKGLFVLAIAILFLLIAISYEEAYPLNAVDQYNEKVGDEIDAILPYLIQVESGGNPNAVSHAGAVGLCQITPIVLKELNMSGWHASMEDLFDPVFNIYVSRWYLRRLRDHYLKDNYTLERMLAAYNGGITRLRRNNYDIEKMPSETRSYVRKIMKLYKGE